jgi:hypothetical protein
MEGKPLASVAKHLWEGPQVSAKVFSSSLLLASGVNLRDLDCLELNNNSLNSSVLSQLLVSNNKFKAAYLLRNLLQLGLALGKIRMELCQEDLVR